MYIYIYLRLQERNVFLVIHYNVFLFIAILLEKEKKIDLKFSHLSMLY